MTKPKSAATAWQPLYRALLGSSSASVRFSRPAARNTRRYLRDDFAAALLTSPSHPQTGSKANSVRQLTANTVAFHLSASLHASGSGKSGVSSPAPPSHATQTRRAIQPNGTSHPKVGSKGRLAHRVISNLASLTYHHLSPYTRMQSPRSAHLRAALRKPKKLSSLARVLGKLDTPISPDLADAGGETDLHTALEGEEGAMLNLAHMKLSFLMPSPKPIRGPKEAKWKNWDGQDPDKIGSEGSLRQMQEDLATIERLLQENGNERGGDKGMGKQVQQLKAEAETLRKKVKAGAKALVQAEEKREMENVGIEALAELIAGAQDREGVMLGKERWAKRARGDFLPP